MKPCAVMKIGAVMKIRLAWLGLLLLVAGRDGAQADVRTEGKYLSFATWRPVPAPTPREAGTPELDFRAFAPEGSDAGSEELAAMLAVAPPPVSREALAGEGDQLHRYTGLPGGIVLGSRALVPTELEGARIARDASGALGLRLDERFGGRFVRAPQLPLESVRACARFVRARLDGLIDLTSGGAPRLAPAFAGSELGTLLARMDRVPHTVLPETRVWKTLIVDRATRVELGAGGLAFGADLEVRCYADAGGTGWARRALVIDALGADFIGPRMSRGLSGELEPLAEIAGWLGFLRWAEHADPAGFGALCAE